MPFRRAAWSGLGAFCLLQMVACGNSGGSHNSGATEQQPGAGGKTTGPDLGSFAGEQGLGGDDSGVGAGEECAGELVEAERIPLDMYVMLDVSGSMLTPTLGDATVTKWQAVSSALTAFVSDDASAGIGVGLQVFPILREEAPASCLADAECGAFGPCLNRGCWPLIDGELSSCFDETNCEASQACVVIGVCSNDDTYVCNRDATATCSQGKGSCAVPPSSCLSQTDCRPATYTAPAADIAELPGAKASLLAAVEGAEPDPAGLTPTGPALQGAIQRAKAWAKAHPERQVVAVLATDGLPTLQSNDLVCAPVVELADIDAVIGLAEDGRRSAPSISTFVIGVVGPDDVGAPVILDAIARSGGSTAAFIVDTTGNVQQEFRDALNQIRETGLSCDLAVPEAAAGKPVDYGRVNVKFTNRSGVAEDLLNVADAAHCADAANGRGWYYDVSDPSVEEPSRISVCPGPCRDFQATDTGSVQIVLGCRTRAVVK